MSRRTVIYYGNMSPFVVILLALLALAAFFLTLPIFLAALVVFAAVAGYYAWRFNKALKKAEEEFLEQQRMAEEACRAEGVIIDVDAIEVTPMSSDEDGPGAEDSPDGRRGGRLTGP